MFPLYLLAHCHALPVEGAGETLQEEKGMVPTPGTVAQGPCKRAPPHPPTRFLQVKLLAALGGQLPTPAPPSGGTVAECLQGDSFQQYLDLRPGAWGVLVLGAALLL